MNDRIQPASNRGRIHRARVGGDDSSHGLFGKESM